jgi:hypothetical protein
MALMLLAVAGLVGGGRQRVKFYLLLAVALALLLSLGLRLRVGDVQPYQWLRDVVPGFGQLRSPFRFAALVQAHLALLVGFGLLNLTRWLPKGWHGVALLATGLVVFESLAWPLPLYPLPAPQRDAPWQAWLSRQSTRPTVVLLPFAASGRVNDFEQTVRWMLDSRYFQAELLNGYSGFFPPSHPTLRQQMLNFPAGGTLDLLRSMQVDYVIVHHDLPGAPPSRRISGILRPVFQDSQQEVTIYAVEERR